MAFTNALRRLLPKRRFARNVSILAGGAGLGQGIVVLASPLLTRLYSPDDFGMLAVYSSMLVIIVMIASLRYEMAILLPDEDEEAARLVVLSLSIVLVVVFFTSIIVLLFRETIASAVNIPILAGYLWLLPVGLSLAGTYKVFSNWAIRMKAFPAIARTRLTQSLGMVGIQLGGFALGPVALLLGQVAGQAAGVTSLGSLAVRKHWREIRAVTLIGVLGAARRYRRFPAYSTWSGLFYSVGTHIPPLLFATLFTPAAAGFYLLAHRILAVPMTLIGNAIADVFFSSAVEALRNGALKQLVAKIHDKLAHIAMPPALLLVLAGPDLFALILGSAWKPAGEFAQWMAPWVYLAFVTSPLSKLSTVLEKQGQGMVFHATLLATRLLALSVAAVARDIELAVALFALGSAGCYFGFLVWVVRVSGNRWAALWTSSLHALAWSALLTSPLIAAQIVASQSSVYLLALGLSCTLVIARYLQLLRNVWQ